MIKINKRFRKSKLNSKLSHNNDLLLKESGPNWGKANIWKWKGLNCHWRLLGEKGKKPLILIHGFGASSCHWRNNAKYFASNNFCVYAIDLIGFGNSEQPKPKQMRFLDNYIWSKQLEDFLEEIVEAKKYGKAILIGNSLGGLCSITLAARRPDLIEKLVAAPLPDPALIQPTLRIMPKIPIRIKAYFVRMVFRLIPISLLIQLIIKTKLIVFALQSAYQNSIERDKELIRIVTTPAKKKSAAGALRSMCIGMSLRDRQHTAPELLKLIERNNRVIPILLVWGREDKLIPLMLGKKLIEQYSWLKLLVLENTGHCPHDESPSSFNQNVLNWLETNPNNFQINNSI